MKIETTPDLVLNIFDCLPTDGDRYIREMELFYCIVLNITHPHTHTNALKQFHTLH